MAEPVRLAKRVAALVPCSRREAELYIAGGQVRVDGVVVEEPHFRVDRQQVAIDAATGPASEGITVLLHKPAGVPDDADSLRRHLQNLQHARPVGRAGQVTHGDVAAAASGNAAGHHAGEAAERQVQRAGGAAGPHLTARQLASLAAMLPLPPEASGVAVHAGDWRIVRKLTEDARTIEQELVVEVRGTIAPNGLARLCRGLVWHDGQSLPPARVSWQNERRLRFALKGIRCETVPWMCAQVGLEVVALRRIRLGRVALAGLAPGQWRMLQPGERF